MSVCRVCLAGNVKLKLMESIPLLNIYEKLTNTQFNSKDERPRVVCSFCYQKFLKCYNFSQMAWRSEMLFDQMLLQGVYEFVTTLKLGVNQHMSMACLQSITLNDSATHNFTVKEEPKPLKEEHTEENQIVKSEAMCRVCIAGNVKLKPMESILLLNLYEKLINIPFNKDGKPRSVCSFCYQKLLQFYTFSKMACRSEKLFDQLHTEGYDELTDELVTKLRLRVKQQMSVSHLQAVIINDSTTNVTPNVSENCKEELKPVQENKHKEHNKIVKSEPLKIEECIKGLIFKQKHPVNFLCPICGFQYETELKLNRHIKNHAEEKHTCNVCNKELKHKYTLAIHMRCHSSNKEFVCTVCNKQFRHLHHLQPHIRTHTGERPFTCTVCQRKFNEKSKLVRHMILHTRGPVKDRINERKKLSCTECDRKFDIMPNLIRHMRVHTGEKPFACSICDKRLQTKFNLDTHMRIHNKDTHSMKYVCHLCDKRFYHKSHLFKHLRGHDEKPSEPKTIFQCCVCNEICTLKKHLISHMHLLHPGRKLYACNDCDKQYNNKAHLIRHFSVHKGKNHACNVCGNKFIHKHNLLMHMRNHTGERPFACSLCGKKFTEKYILNKHVKKKHRVKSETDSE